MNLLKIPVQATFVVICIRTQFTLMNKHRLFVFGHLQNNEDNIIYLDKVTFLRFIEIRIPSELLVWKIFAAHLCAGEHSLKTLALAYCCYLQMTLSIISFEGPKIINFPAMFSHVVPNKGFSRHTAAHCEILYAKTWCRIMKSCLLFGQQVTFDHPDIKGEFDQSIIHTQAYYRNIACYK